ncbi:helix-turn-helix transcriptional regulator [Enterovibrio sp. Hal110]
MTKLLVQTGQFRGTQRQPLRNVLIHAPTIVWVHRGHKQLWWHDAPHRYTPSDWLVVPASHYLTFVNEPDQTQFYSRTMTFHEAPPSEWIQESAEKALHAEPRVQVTPQLDYCFNALFDMSEKALSHDTQRQFLLGFYAELKHVGALHLLFLGERKSVRERLASYLSINPGDAHHIETVANHFSMSRATMVRRLNAESTSFRQVLTHVRMNYALSLMQSSRSQLDVALTCGYQSEARFSSRFKQEFGLTPRQYLKTL